VDGAGDVEGFARFASFQPEGAGLAPFHQAEDVDLQALGPVLQGKDPEIESPPLRKEQIFERPLREPGVTEVAADAHRTAAHAGLQLLELEKLLLRPESDLGAQLADHGQNRFKPDHPVADGEAGIADLRPAPGAAQTGAEPAFAGALKKPRVDIGEECEEIACSLQADIDLITAPQRQGAAGDEFQDPLAVDSQALQMEARSFSLWRGRYRPLIRPESGLEIVECNAVAAPVLDPDLAAEQGPVEGAGKHKIGHGLTGEGFDAGQQCGREAQDLETRALQAQIEAVPFAPVPAVGEKEGILFTRQQEAFQDHAAGGDGQRALALERPGRAIPSLLQAQRGVKTRFPGGAGEEQFAVEDAARAAGSVPA